MARIGPVAAGEYINDMLTGPQCLGVHAVRPINVPAWQIYDNGLETSKLRGVFTYSVYIFDPLYV